MTKMKSSMVRLYKTVLQRHVFDVAAGFILLLVGLVVVPGLVRAHAKPPTPPDEAMVQLEIAVMQNQTRAYGTLPKAKRVSPRDVYTIPISAYNSEVGQTDATPCIAARGFDLCEHGEEDVVAANFLPMGAQVKIPELYGDRVFTVVDRMNARYHYRMDLWMKNKSDAKRFGVKYATIHVL